MDAEMPTQNISQNKPSTPSPSARRFYFGWYVVAACFVILFFNAGARFAIGVAFKPIAAEFGWSRSQISLAFMIQMVVFALSLFAVGSFFDRHGPKKVIIICTLLLAGGCAALAVIQTYLSFLFFFGVVAAVGMGGTGVPLVAALVSRWFAKRRGLVISLALAGTCLGHFALVPGITWMVNHQGWRTSYLLIGISILAANLIMVKWFIRGDPAEMGLNIDGKDDPIPRKGDNPEPVAAPAEQDLTLGQAMKTRAFWLFAILMFVCGSGDFLVTTHLIPMATDHGHSAAAAGNMLALLGLFALAGILLAGPAADKVGNKIPLTVTFGLRVALFLLILYSQSILSFYVFAFCSA
jgi:MFS family permease